MLIGKKVDVLDKGYVACTGTLGDDMTIVQAARVSLLGESKGEAKDKKLLKFLWDNHHTSPFEMVEMAFQVKAPIFVVRQWQRHRMAEYNEESGRYRELEEDFYVPDAIRIQDSKNKQSSVGKHESSDYLRVGIEEVSKQMFKMYHAMLFAGVPREQARMILPLNTYTTMRVKMNAHAWMHFLTKRCALDAQYEIRVYANCLYNEFFRELLPWTSEFFNPIPKPIEGNTVTGI